MHLTGEIVGETVEREERWIGHESAETRRASPVDGGSVALSDCQRGVANDAERRYGDSCQRPLAKHRNGNENTTDIHLQMAQIECSREVSF